MNFPLKVLFLHTVIHNVQKNIIKSAISEMNKHSCACHLIRILSFLMKTVPRRRRNENHGIPE